MHELQEILVALVPGATIAAVPTALLLAILPRRATHTRFRALATWALLAAGMAGLVTGLIWWLQVLVRIGIANDDVRTWPGAMAPTVLCMFVIGAVLHQLLMLGIGRVRRSDGTHGPDPAEPT